MKYYEILYIVNPNFEQPRIDEIKKEVAGEVTKLMSAEIINHRIFGKKRLAYQIEKHKYGIYMLLHLDAKDSTKLIEVNSFFRLNKAIIRHLVVRLDQRPEEDLTPEASNLNVGTAREVGSALKKEAEAPVEEAAVKDVAEKATEASVEETAVETVVEEATEAPDEEAVVKDVAEEATEASVEETVVETAVEEATETPDEETVVETVVEEATETPDEETVVETVSEEENEEPAAEAEPAEKETEDKS
ncbi:MAG: 30S ribosomal protein S6 [Candidatus Marinimicrobia bacterium]|nr:30S ribosomal protein S6 [Candidatus Neomarinimicrobiota bacterium]